MKYKTIKNIIHKIRDLVKSRSFVIYTMRYKCLRERDNKQLFALLKRVGFFKYHSTNNGRIIGLHQLVLYIWEGWLIWQWGGKARKGDIEVHHIDGDISNNTKDNLCYTTPYNNKAISVIVSYVTDKKMEYYNSSVKFDLDRVSLGRGNFIDILIKSLRAVSKRIDKDLVLDFFNSVPYNQAKEVSRRFNYAFKG